METLRRIVALNIAQSEAPGVKSGHAYPQKADIAERQLDVRFVPIADIRFGYSITSSARSRSPVEIDRSSALAVRKLSTSSNFAGRSIGKSAGFAPVRLSRS
jgi:hypothetical protein